MKACWSNIFTILGALLMLVALIFQVISVATPNLVTVGSSSDLKDVLNHTAQEDEQRGDDDEMPFSPQSAYFYYGVWKACMYLEMSPSLKTDMCISWGGFMPPLTILRKPKWLKGVTGCLVAGLAVLCLALIMAGGSLLIPSRGDRRRILPYVICVTSFIAGTLIMVGSLIVVYEYEYIILPFFKDDNTSDAQVLYLNKLSWGFALAVLSSSLSVMSGISFLLAARTSHSDTATPRVRLPQPHDEDVVVLL